MPANLDVAVHRALIWFKADLRPTRLPGPFLASAAALR